MNHVGATLRSSFIAVLLCAWLASASAQEVDLRFDAPRDGQLVLYAGEQPVATYLYRHPEMPRPALVNVFTPSGQRITREFPPTAEDDQDHAWIHAGLWLSFGDVNGHDYWRLQAPVRHKGFSDAPQSNNARAFFTVDNDWLDSNSQHVIAREHSRYQFVIRPDGLLVNVQFELRPVDGALTFGLQEEMGLGVRMQSGLRVAGGSGTITNSEGRTNEHDVWGKSTDWLDYSGEVNNRRLGALVMPSPNNPRRCWAHCRDYGVMVLNPFLRAMSEPKQTVALGPNEPLRLHYQVLYYDVSSADRFDPSRVYRDVWGANK